jgi:multiple sugar transport system ATP-binding protein
VDGGTFKLELPENKKAVYLAYKGKQVIFGIRPESIFAAQFAAPGITPAAMKADVDVTELMGNEIFLYLLTGKKEFVARVDHRTVTHAGEQIDLIVDMTNMHLFDPQTERTLDPGV